MVVMVVQSCCTMCNTYRSYSSKYLSNRCMGDCDGYTCLAAAFSGEASCEVTVSLGLQGDSVLPAEGVWQMQCEQEQRCNVLRGQIGENLDCCPHGRSISE